jgi:uncharacterized membrane protein
VDSRWPKLLFLVLVLWAAIHFSNYYSQLPPVVGSHFNAQGKPNGWQSKQTFYTLFAGVTGLALVLVFAVPAIIGVVPPSLVNLPNKNFWLSPEQRFASREFMSAWFAWFGCAVFLVMILSFDYAVKSNLQPANPPDPGRIGYVFALFGAFSLVWIVRFFLRFARVPRDTSGGV